ncbi:MAG TPA: hypothetical protein QF761_12385, partial [Pirellulales bacterium]|nr:hypothetical protein [Pirellulales bacterium]
MLALVAVLFLQMWFFTGGGSLLCMYANFRMGGYEKSGTILNETVQRSLNGSREMSWNWQLLTAGHFRLDGGS